MGISVSASACIRSVSLTGVHWHASSCVSYVLQEAVATAGPHEMAVFLKHVQPNRQSRGEQFCLTGACRAGEIHRGVPLLLPQVAMLALLKSCLSLMFKRVQASVEAFPHGMLTESLWEGWGYLKYSNLLTLVLGFAVLPLTVTGLGRGRLLTRVLPCIMK